MIKKNTDKLKRKQERETFVGFRPSVIDHKKNYNRKVKHKKVYSAEDQAFLFSILVIKYYNIFYKTIKIL